MTWNKTIKYNLINLIIEFRKSNGEENNIELVINKLLYFSFGLYYLKYEEELFKYSNFEAWNYGAVELDYRYGKNLEKFNLSKDRVKNIKIIFKENKELFLLSSFGLVNLSHTSYPWLIASKTENKIIKVEHIKKYFNKNNIIV